MYLLFSCVHTYQSSAPSTWFLAFFFLRIRRPPRSTLFPYTTLLPILLLAFHPFHVSIRPLSKPVRTELTGRFWHAGCPVSLSRLRVLTVSYWGFDGRVHAGQLIVNRDATAPLTKVFRRLFELQFSIRHMRLADAYGPPQRS